MSDLKICRVCLRTEAKMFKFDQYQLMYYYEEVMALKVNTKDGIPHYFCYECATSLHKFHKFKEKCYRGYKMFKELLWKGPITYERVYKVDRSLSHLTSSLGILKSSKNVKTYTAVSSFYIESDDDLKEESDEDHKEEKKDRKKEKRNLPEFGNAFSDCDEPEIFVETLQPSNDEKLLYNYTVVNESLLTEYNEDKPLLNDYDEPISNNQEIEIDRPGSPTTIFVDEKSEIVKLKSEPVKEVKETTIAIVEPTKRYKFKKPTKFLDATHWKKVVLTEEEAVNQFRARAEDPKYQSWPYKCVDCFKGFSKEDIMKRHRRLRHDESLPLECRFCRMRYKWNTYLRKHMRQHFTKYECLRCHLVCPLESTAMLHDDYHNGVVKKCIHCNEEFTHMSTYYTHLRTHRSEYLCPLCGVSFVSPAGLQQHKRIKHIDDQIESPDDDEEVNTYCEKCDIRFETRKAYDEHLFHSAMHVDGVEDELKDEFSIPRKILGKREKAKITKDLKSERTRSAGLTEAPFKYTRKVGKKKRNPRKPTDCYQCGEHFETQAACMRHHLAAHPRTSFYPSSERHICEVCGASLAPGSVANHTNMHTKEKMYSCDTCGRAFHALISLKRHMVTHTGERPFGCSLCDKKFTQSNSMKLHYRTYHLKQPYPKRNRRKKDQPQTTDKAESSKTDESDESLMTPEARPIPAANVAPSDIHYLTLN